MTTQATIARMPAAMRLRIAFAALLMLGAMVALAWFGVANRPQTASLGVAAEIPRAPDNSPVPAVEPLILDASRPDEARELNAQIPFTTAPIPAARAFNYKGPAIALVRATDCLAAGMLYEAGDDAKGQRAVGQVILNRLRHPAYPKTVCGVVFQGQERSTGCQFTFTCDGAMARTPGTAAWERARANAAKMLAGEVYKPVGYSTHYHTDWVMPYWSKSLDKVIAVDTHLFFRWEGWWGTPGAFLKALSIEAEPTIQKLAYLSPAHAANGEDALAGIPLGGTLIDDSITATTIGPEQIGKRIGPGKLAAIEPGGGGFIMTLDPGGDPARYADAAARLCAGRAQCRLLAWTSAAATPKAFPLADASLASMSFSYIRSKDSGIERILYNCDEFPETPRVKCMLRRTAAAPASRLIADDHSEKSKVRLPDGARPVADMPRGQLVPIKREDATMLRPRADAATAGAPGAL